jgi:hypothetical protein
MRKNIQWRKMKAGTDPVYELTLDGKRSVFRLRWAKYQDLRLTLAAAKLNQFLGLKTVPAQRFAVVNGESLDWYLILSKASRFLTSIKPNLSQRLREAGAA